jgi:hypothetical protein
MLGRLRDALQRRQAAVVEAEALVVAAGRPRPRPGPRSRGRPAPGRERRQHYRLVVAIAERRLAELDGLDTATAYAVGNRWAQRRGSLLR